MNNNEDNLCKELMNHTVDLMGDIILLNSLLNQLSITDPGQPCWDGYAMDILLHRLYDYIQANIHDISFLSEKLVEQTLPG